MCFYQLKKTKFILYILLVAILLIAIFFSYATFGATIAVTIFLFLACLFEVFARGKIKYIEKQIYLSSHPNLPYIYKPLSVCNNVLPVAYPIKNFKYTGTPLKIDKFSRLNFSENEHTEGQKLLILGDSIMGNKLRYNNTNYSIEKLTYDRLKKYKINIVNSSIGGYTIQDIIVLFTLKEIFEKPDYIFINCGYASIRSFLYNNYEHDGSHFRKNIDYFLFLLQARMSLPSFGSSVLKLLYQKILPSNIRDDLLPYVSQPGFSLDNKYDKGVTTFLDHYHNLIMIAKSSGSQVVISTIPHYLYKDSKGNVLFDRIINRINTEIIILSQRHGVRCLDLSKIFSEKSKYFVDQAHLSHEGMIKVADFLSKELKAMLSK